MPLANPMQQVVIPRFGPPEVLEVRNRATPEPGEGTVRVAIRAAGVNFADILARLGLYPDAPRPPLVVGYEFAGVVEAVGRGVDGLHPGERVLGLTRFGGYATHVVVPAPFVFAIPPRVSDVEAAALPVSYLTALVALYQMANVSAGETVLIHSAGGGVGTAATQLARLRRASVIGTASAAKHQALRSMGIEHLIDYRTADVAKEVARLTGGRGVDVVLDPIGGRSFETSYRLLAPLGRLILYGAASIASGERRSWWRALRTVRAMPRFKALSLINRNRGVFGLNLAHLWDEQRQLGGAMRLLLEELEAGRIHPVIAKTFPLAEAGAAHRFVQSRSNIGKVVLTVADGSSGA